MPAYVYILASQKNGTLYVGVTAELLKRVYEHKTKLADGFTKRYGVSHLVYYEVFDQMITAIEREKQLKRWHRAWKINLVESKNKNWDDLYSGLL